MVAGHYDCGAVKASVSRLENLTHIHCFYIKLLCTILFRYTNIKQVSKQDLGLIENWVRGIRDVYRLHGTPRKKLLPTN